ncbi:hypothetical protein NIES2109_22770 [Nostoc sp. HK-01]|nr:hypothetical protein NIES2109_22770 [Nostoc sp. HK-01]
MITTKDKEELFKAHLRGEPIMSISRRLGISHNKIHYWFRTLFNYQKGKCNTLCPIFEEYLSDKALSKADKDIIHQWYSNNLFSLVAEGRGNARPAFVERKLEQNTNRDNNKLLAAAISSRKELENAYDQPTFNQIVLYQRSRFK